VSSFPGAADPQAAGLADQVSVELAALLDEHIAELRARGADESVLTSLVSDLRRLAG
jgi:hypothetical protein